MGLAKHITKAIKRGALPLFVLPNQTIPGASLYWLVRDWEEKLRRMDLPKGSRIAAPAFSNSAFLALLLASFRQEYSFCPLPIKNPEAYLPFVDATVYFPLTNEVNDTGQLLFLPEKRKNLLPLYPEVRLILATSGTTGKPKYVALAEKNLTAVLSSHFRPLSLRGHTLLSVLPWSHAFGLILELLLGILAKSIFVRPPGGAHDIEKALDWAFEYSCDALFSVPLFLEKLLEFPEGEGFLKRISLGLVGGASLSPSLCDFLRNSAFRVGYGQTEASPGITLGKKGYFKPNYIGWPLGCKVIIKDQELYYAGKNVALGYFTENGLELFEAGYFRSRDLVDLLEDGFYFQGRRGDEIKLTNGRFFPAAFMEAKILQELSVIGLVIPHEKEGIQILINSDKYIEAEKIVNVVHKFFPKLRTEVSYCSAKIFQKDPKGNILRSESFLAYKNLYLVHGIS